jgi:hypothetical protein
MRFPVNSLLGICCLSMTAAASFGQAAAQDNPQTSITLPAAATQGGVGPASGGFLASNIPCEAAPALCEPSRSLSLKVIPYLWLTQMNGDITLRGETAPVNLSMGQVWDLETHDLNMAFLGQFEAKYGRMGLLANGLYLEVSPGTQVRRLQFNGEFSQTIVDLAFTYDLLGGEGSSACGRSPQLELLAGVRYNSLTGDVSLTGPRGNTVNAGGAEDWTDLIVGARAEIPVCERWSVLARADVGGFGISGSSQFTWNVEAAAAYQYSERTSLFAGYRALYVDYANGDFAYDMRLDGPMAGFVFKF